MPPLAVPARVASAASGVASGPASATVLDLAPVPASAGGREVACWLHTADG
jgi:hypothetical protein